MLNKITYFFFGCIFLLFPLAHFKVTLFELPLYLSEIPLLFVLGVALFQYPKQKIHWQEIWQENKIFFLGTGLFLLGATFSYALNERTLTGLGMLKSFFILPLLCSFLLIALPRGREGSERILWLWLAGLALTAWTSLIIAIQGWLTYDGRLAGIYLSPNHLAMLLAPGILFSLYFFFSLKNTIQKAGQFFFLSILIGALLLTQSYGAIVSLFIALTMFLFLIRSTLTFSFNKIFVVFTLIFLVITFIFLPTEKFQTLLHGDARSSLASRQMIWTSALKIAGDHWFFGIGSGNFQREYLEYQKYYPPYLEWAVPQPHNLYLALWLQTGVLGLTGLFLVLATLFRRTKYILQQKNLSPEERRLGAAILSLILFFLCYGLVDTPYFKNDLTFAFWGSIGLLLAWVHRVSRD